MSSIHQSPIVRNLANIKQKCLLTLLNEQRDKISKISLVIKMCLL